MRHERLLVIATYPILHPRHGGQKRTQAIVKAYSTAFESVRFVGVFHKASYPDHSVDDIPLGELKNLEEIDKNPLAMDQIVGKSIDNDIHVRSFFAKTLMEYKPDIIHVEQVFLYAGLSVLLKELNMAPVLVYGSQNIEHEMKARIYSDANVAPRVANALVKDTRSLEVDFSTRADLVIAVSEGDAETHRKMGARRVVVARNGIDVNLASSQGRDKKSKYHAFKKTQNVASLVSFIGSGHPPNYRGMIELIGMDTSFMPPRSKLVLGGGVSEYFKTIYQKDAHKSFWKNTVATGYLSEEDLADLIANTDVFMLPILSGGGSNLKTAEAILADKKIVATKYAFRGFENYLTLPNIYIANDEKEFKGAIGHAVAAKFVHRSHEQHLLAQTVRWEYCLAPMIQAVTKVARRRRARVSLWRYLVRLRRLVRQLTSL